MNFLLQMSKEPPGNGPTNQGQLLAVGFGSKCTLLATATQYRVTFPFKHRVFFFFASSVMFFCLFIRLLPWAFLMTMVEKWKLGKGEVVVTAVWKFSGKLLNYFGRRGSGGETFASLFFAVDNFLSTLCCRFQLSKWFELCSASPGTLWKAPTL